jgi:hypothetical protein
MGSGKLRAADRIAAASSACVPVHFVCKETDDPLISGR